MTATVKVVGSADSRHLLEHYCGVPPEIQLLLRRSWEMMLSVSGCFDFGYDGNRVAVLEYNCHSSGALLECCSTSEKMTNYYGVLQGMSTGSFLGVKCLAYFTCLMSNEKVFPKHRLIRFLIDGGNEERYASMHMMNYGEKAGLRMKLFVKLAGFRFQDGALVSAA
ncbi:hypothetical protein, conserved [Leishmania lindenbergi]|uniref:ATP-grasp domain-containing protein n=1 Tax=Leishmania lindenbergi TaxID=651832 RepID=A0AAW3ACM4_9TRYP